MKQPFPIQSAAANEFAQIAFLMAINEYALLSSKGRKAKTAWNSAMKAVENLGLSTDETAKFDALIKQFIESDEYIETEFFRGGQKQTARVTAYRFTKYPTVS